MFTRLLWKLLRASRGAWWLRWLRCERGAAVISALLNLQFDIERKLTQEFRTLGANLVISLRKMRKKLDWALIHRHDGSGRVLNQLEEMRTQEVVAAAPYLHIIVEAETKPVIVAGTWLDEASKLAPTWKMGG